MSQRVTRSAARISAGHSTSNATQPPDNPPPSSRKRKAREPSPEQSPLPPENPSKKQTKRARIEPSLPPPPSDSAFASSRRRGKNKASAAMSSVGPSGDVSEEVSPHGQNAPSSSASRKKQKSKKSSADDTPASRSTSSRRTRKGAKQEDGTADSKEEDGGPTNRESKHNRLSLDDDEDDGEAAPPYPPDDDDDDDDDGPFSGGYLGRPGGPLSSMSSTLRALTGMVAGVSSRLRSILENLKQKDEPSVQLIALQELSEVLLVSNEDNLTGHFRPDDYVKELVALLQPNEFGDENPEIMLLACRCLANLMEALPASTANVVYGGAVPILCQKLLEIHFIDLAEQALSTLEKISVEFPSSIVREGGLTACLTYLDFFATSTQRTAVTTAANCCRNIPEDSFAVVREVMPILENVLSSADQKVLEQGCLCISRIVESFKYQDSKLEELVNAQMLRAILRLLIPGTTNLIGPNIHTQFLRVLSIIARASPKRTVELFQMNVVDTLYQILTGVSPPSGDEDIANKIDSVVIMQALIHRPREQIFETLNVICELLPTVQSDSLLYLDGILDAGYPGPKYLALAARRKSPKDKKAELLKDCREEVKRFAVILLPTLTDAYSSTVNLNVRQKVLTAQLKMLSNLETDILEDALRSVPYASYLASILSQQDHPTLVTFALQAAELLLKRLEPVYRYQFYREGVISEVVKLAGRPLKQPEDKPSKSKAPKVAVIEPPRHHSPSRDTNSSAEDHDIDDEIVEMHDDDEDEGSSEGDDEGNDQNENEDARDRTDSDSSSSDEQPRFAPNPELPNLDDLITRQAKRFLEAHEDDASASMRNKAVAALDELKSLVQEIRQCYLQDHRLDGGDLFVRLAEYFDGDALGSITSYELLTSDVVQALLDVFSDDTSQAGTNARTAFLATFMGPGTETKQRTTTSASPSTPFSILVNKLQDLLSRSEHYEVITVHSNAFDTGRGSAASMLAKQLRLKLTADDDSGVPVAYRNIMVSIHAIATFKALDDYLRPRMSLADRPRGSKGREGMASAMAAYAAAFGGRGDTGRRLPIPPPFAPTPGELADRLPKRGSRSKPQPPKIKSEQDSSTTTPTKRETPRKSLRTKRSESKRDAPVPPPPPPVEENQATLECADEARLTDEEDSLDDRTLDAIVDDLEEEMDGDEVDPGAVNMEVASTGKVTARKEDGTRVATPLAGAAAPKPGSSKPTPTPQVLNTPTTSSRAMSYAAAIQSVPQDWHLEFSVNDQPISAETTIYRAVHFNQNTPGDLSARNIWSAIHTVKLKRVPGPPPAESSSLSPPPETTLSPTSGLPASLDKNPITAGILRLLNILHGLNSNIDDVLAEHHSSIKLNAEPASQFVNTKLTAKLNRQMEEPLIVASNCLPSWAEDLARLYPFLFPFETRHLFLQSTSFGYSRSMTRWQSAQDSSASDSRHRHRDERPFLGRLMRQKVRISRTRILEAAVKVMEMYGSSPSILEVEYFEEVGTGLGPTLEFYSTVSKEFSKKRLKLWRENESNDTDDYAFGKGGLFPAPMSEEQTNSDNGKKVLHLYRMLGKFVARSMLDSRIIDVNFNPTFFRIANDANSSVTPSLGAVRSVDADLANSLRVVKRFASTKKRIDENPKLSPAQKVNAIQNIEIDGAKVEDLALDFTLPGYPTIELRPGGADISVTTDNVCDYVDAVLDITLGKGVKKQIDSFKEGFGLVFPYAAVRAFTPEELVMLYGRVEEDWSLETLMDSIKADHGFNLDSKSVRNLLTIMSEMDVQQRRDFLQFVSGSPKLPIGGFKALTPMFTVVCKPSEPPYSSDDYLPSVMTCVNYLKLPDYSNLDVMRTKLGVAIKEGQGAFHLS